MRAGLIPALRAESGSLAAIRVLTPGEHPLRTHEQALRPKNAPGDTVLVVDQFEEVFTLCGESAERAEFIGALLAARQPDSRLRVVIAVRADFYGRCAEHRGLADALRDTSLLVGPMSPAELREAVVRPAQSAGLIVERELTARLVEEVDREPGGLPLPARDMTSPPRPCADDGDVHRGGRCAGRDREDRGGGIRPVLRR